MKNYKLSESEQKIFDDNRKLVDFTLYKFFKYSTIKKLGVADIRDIGYLSLCNAIKNYNAEKGIRFSTYAIKSIRRGILNALGQKQYPLTYESIDPMRDTEVYGYPINGCRKLLSVEYFPLLLEEIADSQIVEQINCLAKNILSEHHYKIYDFYYVQGLSAKEIGDKLNVTRCRIYQVIKKINTKIRLEIESNEMFDL